jgi:1-deoxy-D-xylulose-5-phosphate synthase
MLHDAMTLADSGPVVIRYPKGTARQVTEHDVGSGLSARKLSVDPAAKVCVLAVGKLVGAAQKAIDALAARNVAVTLWDVRSCVPADPAMLDDAARHDVVLTYEDGIADGGIGALLTEAVRQRDGVHATRFVVRGVPTRFIPHAKPDVILAQLGLDAAGIEADVLSSLGR